MGTLAKMAIKLLGDNQHFYDQLDDAEKRSDNWATNLGSKIKTGLTAAITAGAIAAAGAIAGIGTAAINTSMQLDQAANMATTQLGGVITEAHDVDAVIKQVFGNNFGENIADAGQAVIDTAQQLDRFGTMTDQQLANATENAIRLRDAFGIEVAESTNAVNALMENFGITADEAFGFVQSGLQNGLNNSGDFLDTIGEYSVQFAEGGAQADDFFSILDTGLQAGMLGTDKAGDLFKEFRLRIQDGSSSTADALAAIGINADEMASSMSDGSLSAIDAFWQVQDALQRVDDENAQFNAGVALMGSQFEDLGARAVLAIDDWSGGMGDVLDLTSDLDAQYNNFGSRLEGFKRRALLSLEPFGDKLIEIADRIMPHLESGLDWLGENLPDLIDNGVTAFETFLDVAENFIKAIITAPDEGGVLLDYLQELPEGLQPVAEALGNFAIWLKDDLPAAIDAAQPILTALSDWFSEHGATVLQVILGIGAGLAAFSVISTIVGAVTGFVATISALSAAFTAAGGGITAVVALLGGPVTLVIAAVAGLIALLAAAWAGNWGGIRDITANVIAFIQGLIQQFVAFAQGWWASHGESVMIIVNAFMTGAQNTISNTLTFIRGTITEILTGIQAFWSNWGDTIMQVASLAWDNVKITISTALEVIGLIIDTFAALLQGNWQLAWDNLILVVTTAVDGIVQIFTNLGTMLITTANTAITNLKNTFLTFPWGDIGDGIAKGVADGLANGAGKIFEAARYAASQAVQVAKDALGISSPSKVAAMLIGMPFTEGIALGISDTSPISQAIQGLGDAMIAPDVGQVNTAQDSVAAGAAQAGALPNLSIQITVEAGADVTDEKINNMSTEMIAAARELGLGF